MTVHRFDRGTLKKPTRTPEGWLRVDGHLTRTGVFLYRDHAGKERRELRLPEEVFSEATLKSFAMVPVTDEHPPKFLDASNTREFSRGSVSEVISRDDHLVRASLIVTDAELVAKLTTGKAQEISCGYTCELEEKAGEHNGEKFDCIQRNIVGNHVAIVPVGRAGPEARVRMDGASFQVLEVQTPGEPAPTREGKTVTVKTIRIDGVDFEVGTEAHLQAIAKRDAETAKELAAVKAERDEAKKALDVVQAKADAAADRLAKLDEEMKALPAKLAADFKQRADLESKARTVLGEKFDLAKLDTKGVQLAVLTKLQPKADFSKKTDAQIEARFDVELEQFTAETPEPTKTTATDDGEPDPLDPFARVVPRLTADEMKAPSTDAEMARRKMIQRQLDRANS